MSEPTPEPADRPSPTPSPSPNPLPSPSPGPRHAVAQPTPQRHPRRWFLAGAGLTVLAAGGGVGAAYLRPSASAAPDNPPPELTAAIAAERTLLADLDATTGGTADVRRVLVRARADHAAHLQALTALAAGYDARPARPVTGAPRSAAYLRRAEQNASAAAAGRAASLDDVRLATLLASIAACEATHAELLA